MSPWETDKMELRSALFQALRLLKVQLLCLTASGVETAAVGLTQGAAAPSTVSREAIAASEAPADSPADATAEAAAAAASTTPRREAEEAKGNSAESEGGSEPTTGADGETKEHEESLATSPEVEGAVTVPQGTIPSSLSSSRDNVPPNADESEIDDDWVFVNMSDADARPQSSGPAAASQASGPQYAIPTQRLLTYSFSAASLQRTLCGLIEGMLILLDFV